MGSETSSTIARPLLKAGDFQTATTPSIGKSQFTDGRVAGNAGVNRYNASVTAGPDGSLAVDPPISTKMAGPADATAAEQAFLARLQSATSYRVVDDSLMIEDADGQSSLTFTRA